MLSDHSQEIKSCKYLGRGGEGGGYLRQFLLGMCHWPLRAPTPILSILWPIIDPSHYRP